MTGKSATKTWVLVSNGKREIIRAEVPPAVIGPRSTHNLLGPFATDAAAELCVSGDFAETHRSVTEFECLAVERSGATAGSIAELLTPRSSFYLTDGSGLVWVRRDGIFAGYRKGDDGAYRAERATVSLPRGAVRHRRGEAL